MFPDLDIEKWLIWKILVKISPVPYKQILLMIPLELSIARCNQKFDPFPDTPKIRKKRHTLYVLASNERKFISIDADKKSAEVFEEIIK